MRIAPVAALVLCGCYVTTPVPLAPAPQAGTKLHVQLTDAGATSLAQYLGPGVGYIDGRLLAQDDTSMSLAVTATTLRSGNEQMWKGETVSLPHSAIATVQVKKVSWWRSALVAGGLIAAVTTVGIVKGQSTGGTRGHGPPGQQ